MNGQTLQKAFAPLPGGGQTVYNSSGLLYYAHTDHLGSFRFASTPSRTMYFDMAYAPFGETYAASGSADASFTTQRQDTVAGLYDFPAREYSIQGRWPSPDPAGLASVDPTNPQSWNRYAYVMNNPLALTDPSGLGPTTGATCLLDEMGNCHGGGGGGSCTIDGFAADCGMANGLLQSGAGIICNTCGIGTQAVLGPGGSTILQQWIPTITWTTGDAAAGYVIHQTMGYWQTTGISEGGGGLLDTFWNIWSAYWRRVPWAGSVLIPIRRTGGMVSVMIPWAYIPKTQTGCLGIGLAATTPTDKVFSGGPLVTGNLDNANNILSGVGFSFSGQSTSLVGVQATSNSSGSLGGPTGATGTGLSGGFSWSYCGSIN